jgi:hypothetical protein
VTLEGRIVVRQAVIGVNVLRQECPALLAVECFVRLLLAASVVRKHPIIATWDIIRCLTQISPAQIPHLMQGC